MSAAAKQSVELVGSGFAEPQEQSGTFDYRLVNVPHSTRMWGLDLYEEMPRSLSSDGVEAHRGDLPRIRDFLALQYSSLTQEGIGEEASQEMADAKLWFLSRSCDCLELRHEDSTVGILIGAPEDWGTYYVRSFALERSYQRPGLIRRFVRECLFAPLERCKVERVVAETSPANLAMTRLFTELRFHATGHQLSDRWGPLVRYTKFLDPACEAAFLRRFAGTAPTRSGRGTSQRKEKTA